jgi:hypothetical protein
LRPKEERPSGERGLCAGRPRIIKGKKGRWLERKIYCFSLRQEGKIVHWVRNDGLSGKATIVR